MGCFHSKVSGDGSRTPSLRIGVCLQNDRIRSRIFEDLVLRDREDKFLALLYNPSAVVMKLKAQEGRDKLKVSAGENCRLIHDGPHMVNAWELMAGLDEEEAENEEMKDKKDEQCSSTDQPPPPASDDGGSSLAQIDDEIHVTDFLSADGDNGNDDDNSAHETGEPFEVGESTDIHAEATTSSRIRDGGDVLSESIRFLVLGERSDMPEESNVSGEEKCTSTPSFRFMAADHLKLLRMGSEEEEEAASGSSTPTFGAFMESELGRGTTADDHHGIGVSFQVHLEDEALMTDEDEHVFMKILQDFLDRVHEAN